MTELSKIVTLSILGVDPAGPVPEVLLIVAGAAECRKSSRGSTTGRLRVSPRPVGGVLPSCSHEARSNELVRGYIINV